jgi:Cu-Zn family superoxide dismutase
LRARPKCLESQGDCAIVAALLLTRARRRDLQETDEAKELVMRGKVAGAIALWATCLFGLAQALASGEKTSVEVKDRDGKSLGTVAIVGTVAGALIEVRLKGLPEGAHGFHLHETGKCDGDFSSAGAIYNPLGTVHGFLNEEGPMAGDLTNLFADASGRVEADIVSPRVTVSKDDESIFDDDGTALVIFEKADDYLTEPEGNAGARIACGAIPPTPQ